MMSRIVSVTFCLVLLVSSPALASTLSGTVVRIADGDTIVILTSDKEQVKIRLVEIDAPEKDQPYGQDSKKALSDLVFGKNVTVEWGKADKYKRILGRVFVDDIDVNLEQVKTGAAWAYTQYLTDDRIRQAEVEARKGKIGLWALQSDQIVSPWEWRRRNRKAFN